MDLRDELTADVVIVGFGAAGACAAIEAARAGAEVVLIDRFAGGGATALSGGVVYAGGGTEYQRAAGVDDTPDAMFAYLSQEIGDAVSPRTLRRFCDESAAMVAWLAELGVPFEGSLCPYKTSYPSDRHYLYFSGSEASGGFRDVAPPVPRGHRVRAPGTSGKALFAHLAAAVESLGVRVLTQTTAQQLVLDGERVVGVDCAALSGAPVAAHRALSRYATKPGLYVPPLRRLLHGRAAAIERRSARPLRVRARQGVVLAAGGFVADRAMLRAHAPAYRGGLPLGTAGDDGSAIRLGVAAGGATARLDSVSAWRFITPPSAFLSAVLVGPDGRRICDESRYGAAIGRAMIEEHGGRGWLLVDAPLVAEARQQLHDQTVWFQRMQARHMLGALRVSGSTVEDVARAAGLDAVGLRATLTAHNDAARAGAPDPAGKPAEFVRPLLTPPFSLIDVSVRPSRFYPCPMLTLGGLVVDEDTGAVLRADGAPIAGLHAAGRSAVGLCSNSYISGLSLADCVFSGRRAGRRLAGVDRNENAF
ncbi:FAD-binding protein [Pseudonocardia sp. CA-107938]|uniref:FAD-binding protein n=1 Tax=Pseudonocardia sp. CA-107938 TaxID=3240021 RepID=UPI003D8D6A8C